MIRRTLIRAAVLAGLWCVLAGPKLTGWYAGLAAIGLALLILASLARNLIPRIDPRGLSAFIPFFLVRVIQGGVDVSKRALSPTLPLSPDIVLYESRLPAGAPRTLVANTISLLPGTFTAELREDGLLVHLLARTPDSEAGLAELERRVGAVFGLARRRAGGRMSALYAGAAFILLLNLGGGLARVVLGPTPADRMVVAQLLGKG